MVNKINLGQAHKEEKREDLNKQSKKWKGRNNNQYHYRLRGTTIGLFLWNYDHY